MFSDGVVVASKVDSDVIDEFLSDVTDWMVSTIGYKRVETHDISKIYESDVVFRATTNILKCLDVLGEIQTLITTQLKKANSMSYKLNPVGFALAVDNTLIPGLKPSVFRVERKADIAFDKNLFVSRAPLPTKAHLAVLNALEKLR